MTNQRSAKGIEAPADVRDAVKRLIKEAGEAGAEERLALSSQTVARLASGMKVHRATIGQVRLRLGLAVAVHQPKETE